MRTGGIFWYVRVYSVFEYIGLGFWDFWDFRFASFGVSDTSLWMRYMGQRVGGSFIHETWDWDWDWDMFEYIGVRFGSGYALTGCLGLDWTSGNSLWDIIGQVFFLGDRTHYMFLLSFPFCHQLDMRS